VQSKSANFADIFNQKTGRNPDDSATVIHLMEEVGELAREIYNDKSGRDKLDKENLADELADVFILLSCIGDIYDIDLEDAVIRKIEKDSKKIGVKL